MKALLIALVCLFTIYAPLKLTIVIIAYGLSPKFVIEIAFMWVFYLAFLAILIKVAKV